MLARGDNTLGGPGWGPGTGGGGDSSCSPGLELSGRTLQDKGAGERVRRRRRPRPRRGRPGLGERHGPEADVQLSQVGMVAPGGRGWVTRIWGRRWLPSPTPSPLFTFPVLLAEPPVDALHHPGQLLLLQLPLLLPGRRNDRGPGPVSASSAATAGLQLHVAAAAAAPRTPADARLTKEVGKEVAAEAAAGGGRRAQATAGGGVLVAYSNARADWWTLEGWAETERPRANGRRAPGGWARPRLFGKASSWRGRGLHAEGR